MNKVFLIIGSNLDNPAAQLARAETHIEKRLGHILNASSLYRTEAWGTTDQPDFFNRVLIVETKFTAPETLNMILHIEAASGRIRTEKNAPRIIDIDILFFNNDIFSDDSLTIPHREIPHRRFVLTPLAEIAPNFVHPVLKKDIRELLRDCGDKLNVQKI